MVILAVEAQVLGEALVATINAHLQHYPAMSWAEVRAVLRVLERAEVESLGLGMPEVRTRVQSANRRLRPFGAHSHPKQMRGKGRGYSHR